MPLRLCQLLSGINFIPLVVGMFAFGQVLTLMSAKDKELHV